MDLLHFPMMVVLGIIIPTSCFLMTLFVHWTVRMASSVDEDSEFPLWASMGVLTVVALTAFVLHTAPEAWMSMLSVIPSMILLGLVWVTADQIWSKGEVSKLGKILLGVFYVLYILSLVPYFVAI